MKYLYVLVSDNTDYYYEQALMSITSLKMRMSNGFVSLLIDDTTEKNLINNRHTILDMVDELKIITIQDKYDKKRRSRWLKTTMRQHIEGDFLYIDCDTIITDDLSDISDFPANLAAVIENHSSLENINLKNHVLALYKKLQFTSSFVINTYFNGGILFCRDVPVCYDFFNEWHKLWLMSISKNISLDEPALNQANFSFNNIITELDGIWNCQIIFDGAITYLAYSKIIHYFNDVNTLEKSYLLADQHVLRCIKEKGCVTQEIKEKLKYPRVAFNKNTRLISDKKQLAIMNSLTFIFLRKMWNIKLVKCFDFVLLQILHIKNLFCR